MMIKRLIRKGLALLLVFVLQSGGVLDCALLMAQEMNLGEFLRTTDEVSFSYNYPKDRLSQGEVEGDSILKAHTPVIIRSKQTINTNNLKSGTRVYFAVVNNVVDRKGNILIKANEPVVAQVHFSKSAGMLGKSEELVINDFHTRAVDGSYIALSASISSCADDKSSMSILLSVLVCPLFLLMKGEDVQLLAGATKTAYTIMEARIKTLSDL